MKATIEKQSQINVIHETSTFALGVGIVAAALVGIWGLMCLVSALSSNGPVNLVKSLISAITGS